MRRKQKSTGVEEGEEDATLPTSPSGTSASPSGPGPQQARAPQQRLALLIHINIFVYSMAYWLVSPLLPFLIKRYGGTTLSFGYMQSLFSIVQLGGGLAIGAVQDRFGGSVALSVTQLGSAVVYLVVVFASSLNGLYLSRLPTVLQQAMQVSQAMLAASAVSDAARVVSLGRLSLSYGLGMVAGSMSSAHIDSVLRALGVLSQHRPASEAADANVAGDATVAPAVVAGLLTLGIVAMNAAFFPAVSAVAPTKKKNAASGEEKKSSDVGDGTNGAVETVAGASEGYVGLVLRLRRVVSFLLLLFATKAFYEPVLNATLLTRYKITPAEMGRLMSLMASIGMGANIFLLPLLTKVLSERRLMVGCIFVAAAVYGGLCLLPGLQAINLPQNDELIATERFWYEAALSLSALVSSILYTALASYASRTAPPAMQGRAMALSHALRSGVGIVCPVIGTMLWEFGNTASSGTMDAVAGLNVALLLLSVAFA